MIAFNIINYNENQRSMSSNATLIPSNQLLSASWDATDANQWELNDRRVW